MPFETEQSDFGATSSGLFTVPAGATNGEGCIFWCDSSTVTPLTSRPATFLLCQQQPQHFALVSHANCVLM